MYSSLICSQWLTGLVAPIVLDYPPLQRRSLVHIFSEPNISATPGLIAFTTIFFCLICSQWLRDLVAPSVQVDYPPRQKFSLFQMFPNQALLRCREA